MDNEQEERFIEFLEALARRVDVNLLDPRVLEIVMLDPERVAVQLIDFINRGCWRGIIRRHTVTIGRYGGAQRAELELSRTCEVTSYARSMMELMEFAQEERTLHILEVSVEALGFPLGITHRESCRMAHNHGWLMCPAEAALVVRAQCLNQCTGVNIFPVMNKIHYRQQGHSVFQLLHKRGHRPMLHANTARSHDRTLGSARLLFLEP
jgi:hypothetical protein